MTIPAVGGNARDGISREENLGESTPNSLATTEAKSQIEVRLDGTRGIAVSLDGPPIGERDPFRAGWAATMEAAMNVACAGGEPAAIELHHGAQVGG